VKAATQSRYFCAAESRAGGETVYGTVARIRSWLLIEYPSAWRRNAIEDSRLLPDAVRAHIRKLEKTGAVERSILIRREHRRSGPIHCFHVRSCASPPTFTRTLLSDYDELPHIGQLGEPVRELMYAVCTHGRHDKCCAKFGLPVFCEFRDQVGQLAWQCSHVGGDRFAGNVVVFPHGVYYGRVNTGDVAEIVRSSERGEIWLPGYRGRSCYPRAVQVAEYFARAESGRMGIDEFCPIEAQQRENVTQVRFEARSDASIHSVEFTTRRDALTQLLTCGSSEPSAVPQYDLRRYTMSPL
jgi:hypothetical protein